MIRSRTAATTAGLALAVLTTLAAQGPAPRLAPVAAGQMSDEQRKVAAQLASSPMPNMAGTLLHHPAVAQAVMPHVAYVFSESTLPARPRALLGLRAIWLAQSGYLWAHRAAAAKREGLTDADLTRVARGPDAAGWDAFEATLVRAADELHADSIISDATWTTLSARYDIPQMIDVIDTVGALTMYAGVVNTLGVQVEAGVSERLPSGLPATAAATKTNMRLEGRGPRIPPVDAPGGRGGGANVFRTFTRNPPADRVRGAINSHVNSRANTLEPRHRELLLMRIGVLCRSEYEFAAHARVGRGLGMTPEDVARIIAGPGSGGSPIEDALLRATDELYERNAVSPATWGTLAKSLDTRQLIDVLMAVGGYHSTSLLINSAGVQLDANMADFRFPPDLR